MSKSGCMLCAWNKRLHNVLPGQELCHYILHSKLLGILSKKNNKTKAWERHQDRVNGSRQHRYNLLLLKLVIQSFVREQIRFRKQQPGPSFFFFIGCYLGLHLLLNWLEVLPWKGNTGSYMLLTSASAAATMRCFGTKNHFSHYLSLEWLIDIWSINFHCYWPD